MIELLPPDQTGSTATVRSRKQEAQRRDHLPGPPPRTGTKNWSLSLERLMAGSGFELRIATSDGGACTRRPLLGRLTSRRLLPAPNTRADADHHRALDLTLATRRLRAER